MGRARAFLFVLVAAYTFAGGSVAAAAEQGYTVRAEGSAVRIHVGKSGVFGFAGHEHEVLATGVQGTVIADSADLARSSVNLAFDTASLKVTGDGEPAKDVPKVQAVMIGPDVLDIARFPSISFRSRSVAGKEISPGVFDVQVTGDLELHGVSRSLTLPMHVEVTADKLTATGRTTLSHTEFGMKPVSAGAGTVKVKNEIGVDYRIVARAGR